MLNSYIIEKNKLLGDVIVDIKEQYPNHLFKFNLLDYSNLVSIITDQSLRDLAQTIHVPVKSIATTSRIKRLKSINTILFMGGRTIQTTIQNRGRTIQTNDRTA